MKPIAGAVLVAALASASCVMPEQQISNLRFPFAGLVKDTGYQYQEPYSSADLNNVRPRDPATGRLRGGARPMLARALSTQIGSGNPVYLLATVKSPATNRTYEEPFSGTALSSDWTQWDGATYDPLYNGRIHTAAGYTLEQSFRHSNFGTFDDTQPWSLEMDIDTMGEVGSQIAGNQWAIHWQRNSSSTAYNLSGCYRAVLALGATWTPTNPAMSVEILKTDVQQVLVSFTDTVSLVGTPGVFRIEVVPGTSVKAYWRGILVANISHTTSANKYVGFGMKLGSVYGGSQQVSGSDGFRFFYVSTVAAGTEKLLASSNGAWYLENSGAFSTLTTTVAGNSSAVMQAAPHLGKLFVVNCTTPLYYDTDDSDTHDWAAAMQAGSLPTGPKLICEWNGRIVITDGSNVYYMSRQGNPFDFDYGAPDTDLGRAVAGTSTDTDQLGEAIKALMPFNRDYLVMGCVDSMWMMNGDPAAGGVFVNLSRTVGIVGPNAWCITPSGEIVFLSRYGLYLMQPGGIPVPLSKRPLPRELLGISSSTYYINLTYDVYNQGIKINLTPITPGAGVHYFLDWETQTYWPETYQTAHQPITALAYSGFSSSGSKVMIGGSNGYVRRHSDSATDDDGSACSSYVFYGPFPLGGPLFNGEISQLQAVLGDDSGTVSWEARVGSTAQAALAATARASGTFSENRNHLVRPGITGSSGAIKLSATVPWSIEELIMVRTVRGRIRL